MIDEFQRTLAVAFIGVVAFVLIHLIARIRQPQFAVWRHNNGVRAILNEWRWRIFDWKHRRKRETEEVLHDGWR